MTACIDKSNSLHCITEAESSEKSHANQHYNLVDSPISDLHNLSRDDKMSTISNATLLTSI